MTLTTGNMMGVKITCEDLALPSDVRSVNAPVRTGLTSMGRIANDEHYLVDTRDQADLMRLQGIDMVYQLENHEIPVNASVGVWFFGKGSTRFHEGYEDMKALTGGEKGSNQWLEYVFMRAQEIEVETGLKLSLQAHYPNEIGPQNAATWVKLMGETGIGVDSIVPFLFGPKEFQYGSLTNPDPRVRALARQVQLETFQLAKLLGISVVNHWLGTDGHENAFAVDHTWALDHIIGATADTMTEVPGQQATFEPKPYEPRGHNFNDLTHTGIIIARAIEERLINSSDPNFTSLNTYFISQGFRMVGLTPEIGHMQMGYESLPYSFELALREGRLFGIHWNSQPLGNYDIDANPGVYNFEALAQIAYVLQRGGFRGVNCLDINPLRMDLVDAVKIGFLNLQAAFKQVRSLPHEMIITAVNNPSANGNAALELIQLASRYPGSPEAAEAMRRAQIIVSGKDARGIADIDGARAPMEDSPVANVNMTREEVTIKVVEIIAKQMKIAKGGITNETRLKDDLNMMTIDRLYVNATLDEIFGTDMQPSEKIFFKRVGEMVDYIMKKAPGSKPEIVHDMGGFGVVEVSRVGAPMTEKEVADKLINILADHLGLSIDQIRRDSKLDQITDSFDRDDLFEIAMVLETEFKINIPDNEIEKLQTVDDLIKCVLAILNDK